MPTRISAGVFLYFLLTHLIPIDSKIINLKKLYDLYPNTIALVLNVSPYKLYEISLAIFFIVVLVALFAVLLNHQFAINTAYTFTS